MITERDVRLAARNIYVREGLRQATVKELLRELCTRAADRLRGRR